MRIETISTGDEVITGFVTDTNVSWLCQNLLSRGIQVARRQTVSDDLHEIMAVLDERSKAADIIIVNGGLGPTSDDRTTEAAAKVANVPLEQNILWAQRIKAYCDARGNALLQTNIKQAFLPKGAELIDNPHGTACGYKIKINNAVCYFTPGVPSEFKAMIDSFIAPDIAKQCNAGQTSVRRYFVLGISESKIAGMLDAMNWPEGMFLGYRADFPLVEVKLIAHGAAECSVNDAEKQLLPVIKPYLAGKGKLNIPERISILNGVVPFRLLECGTGGRAIKMLAGSVHGLSATYGALPENSEELIALAKNGGSNRTLAIGPDTEKGMTIVYFDGFSGFMQTLNPNRKDPEQRKLMISYIALDMVQRILSGQPNPFAPYETVTVSEQCSL